MISRFIAPLPIINDHNPICRTHSPGGQGDSELPKGGKGLLVVAEIRNESLIKVCYISHYWQDICSYPGIKLAVL